MTEQLDMFVASVSEEKEERLPQESELSPTHWKLYNLIKHNSFVEHRKTTQKEICDKIDFFEYDESGKSHDHCSAIWKYIKDNNESLEHDKLIISKDFTYWIGSRKETKSFLLSLWKALSPRLKRYWRYVDKVKMDGVYKLFDKNGNPIENNSKVKTFHECFIDYDNEMQKAIEENKENDEYGEERISD